MFNAERWWEMMRVQRQSDLFIRLSSRSLHWGLGQKIGFTSGQSYLAGEGAQ
jgi:hypothetical protein